MSRWFSPVSQWSLQRRIHVSTILLSASVLVIANWVTTRTAVNAVEGTIGVQTSNAAQRLAHSLSHSSVSDVPLPYKTLVREILELEPNIVRVDLYAEIKGELKNLDSSSFRGDRVLEGEETRVFYTQKAKTFIVQEGVSRQVFSVSPIYFSDGTRGFVSVVSSLQTVDEILSTQGRIRIYSLVVTVGLMVFAVGWLFRNTVYRTVNHLLDVMYRFREGETTARASEKLTGELGELGRGFNFLLEEVQKYHEELQSRVDAATSQLRTRNKDLKKLNLQLLETQRKLTQAERLALAGQLTATFAHEIGSPLSAISTHLQMMLEDTQLDPKIRERLYLAGEQIDRVCGIVENLLNTTRSATQLEAVELVEIACKISQLLEPTFESRHIQFNLTSHEDVYWISGNVDQLQQLFLNLLNNSLEAVQEQGKICVELRRIENFQAHSDFVQVKVSDSGIGIPQERQLEIFKPFFTTKEFEKGTGLGLALCKSIVAHHQGSITVESGVGQGACFTIIFPLIPDRVPGNSAVLTEHHEVGPK
jgi:signal transduction histidine kinase